MISERSINERRHQAGRTWRHALSAKRIIRRAIVGFTLVAAAWSGVMAPASAATQVRVVYIPIVDALPLFVAKDQGFFAKRDLDVTATAVANQGVVVSSLASKSAEIGFTVTISMLQAREAGLQMKAVAGAAAFPIPVPRNVGVVAKTGSGIKGPADLVGKRVGVIGLRAFHHIMVQRWLAENGVDYNKVRFAEVAFPLGPDLLKAGQVDAVVSVDPFFKRMIDTGIGYVVGDFMGTVPDGTLIDFYMATADWAKDNAAAARGYREALAEAADFIAKNPDSARASLATWTKQPPAVVASTNIPVYRVDVTAAQIDYWIDLLKHQGIVKGAMTGQEFLLPR
jgi:NitT/TauT family transport system substrate-binding protein